MIRYQFEKSEDSGKRDLLITSTPLLYPHALQLETWWFLQLILSISQDLEMSSQSQACNLLFLLFSWLGKKVLTNMFII